MSKKLHKRVSAALPTLLWLMLLALWPVQLSAFATKFEYTYEGRTLRYYVVDEDAKTVGTMYGNDFFNSGNGSSHSGDLIIPSEVTYNSNTYTVIAIGSYSFPYSSGLKSITIPNSVTTINTGAFAYCSGLTEIKIPASVTSIGKDAFRDCTGVTEIKIPASVTSIGEYAFRDCTGLTSFTLEDGQETLKIESGALYNAPIKEMYIGRTLSGRGNFSSTITSLTFGNTVTSIPNNAFDGATDLKTLRLGSAIKTIGDQAFSGCSGLTEIKIPDSVTKIGISAFKGCSGVTDIKIPNSVTSIGSNAFSECSSLTSFTLEDGQETLKIGSAALYEAPIKEIYIGRNYNYSGDGSISNGITSLTFGNTVTSIPNYAFNGATNLTEIKIPASVTLIGDDAFRGCTGLTSCTLEDGQETLEIGSNALYAPIKEMYIGRTLSYSGNGSICYGITSLTFGNTVTSIQKNAFNGATNLKTLKLGSSIKTIGDYAFYDCSGLTEIKIPDSVTSIGSSAFKGCSGLTELTIGNSVTTIGGEAFEDCSGVTSVIIPNSVTEIGNSAFKGCKGLTQLTIGNSVTTIGNYAFSGCSGLTEIKIPDSVTSIGNYAFSGCSGLTEIKIPDSVTSIGGSAFSGCSGLTSVIIPNSVTEIGINAFLGCSGLKKSAYPSNMGNPFRNYYDGREFYGIAVEYPAKGNYTYDDGYIWSENKTGLYFVPIDVEGEFSIPSSVTTIGGGAFNGCTGLTSVIIPNSVTEIGESAFYGCSGLTEMTIGNSVTTIGNSAFYGCSGLTSVIIPNSVTKIGNFAFLGCSGLKKSAYPSNIGDPFYNGIAVNYPAEGIYTYDDGYIWSEDKTGLYFVPIDVEGEFSIPSSVTTIGRAFYGCTAVTSVIIPNSVTTIGEEAFYGCTGLTSVIIPNSVTEIDGSAFSGCDGLTELTIGNSVKSIGSGAFRGCTGLTSVIIPNSVTEIDGSAFSGCSGLWKSAYPSNLKNPFIYGGNLVYGTVIEYPAEGLYNYDNGYIWSEDKTALYFVPLNVKGDFIIPSSVTKIGENAFYGCYGLKKVAYPSSTYYPFQNAIAVSYPAEGTFEENGYIWAEGKSGLYFVPTSVEGEYSLPESVTTIGKNAFTGCQLTTVNAHSTIVPEMDREAFAGLYDKCLLNVPDNLFANYMATSNWYLFENVNNSSSLDNGNFKYRTNPADNTAVLVGPAKIMSEATILAKVSLDNKMYTVIGIGSGAFKNASLSKVTFRNGIEIIGDNAFDKNNLQELVLPESVKSIGDYAFARNNKLASATIGSDVETIGDYAFQNDALTEIAIPGSVKTIGNYAFAENTNLASATIGSGVETIGNYAFHNDALTEVTIPGSVKTIGNYAFAENANLASATIGSGVETICNNAFHKDALTEVTIPGSVKTIGDYAFAENTNLASATIGSGVETIGDYAFQNDALTEVAIPGSVKTIGDYAFAENANLASATIGSGVEAIGNYAFAGNANLASATIGTGVKTIGDYAFHKNALTEVAIPGSVKTIGSYAFAENANLASATIGSGVETIGDNSFRNCALAEVLIPASVNKVGESAFVGNKTLSTVIFSESADKVVLDTKPFDNLTNLTMGRNYEGELPTAANIEFGNLFTEITEGFMRWRSSLKSVKFGTGISEIPASAFYGCSLSEVVLPSNITTIGESAFGSNKLTNVIIGCGTAEIGRNAFAHNNSIATINVTAVEPPVATDDVFSTQNAQLNVLKESREAYENAVCWYQFEGLDLVPISVFKILNESVPAKAQSSTANSNGKQIQLTVSVEPANASLKDYIFWSSSNPEVATVDNNGLVTFTGATEGTSEITAKTLYDGVVASTKVTADGSAGIDNVIFDSNNGNYKTVNPNDIYNLQGICLKRNASQEDVDALAPGLYIIAGKKVLVK